MSENRPNIVKAFLDKVLDKAGDHYNEPPSALLADFIDFSTEQPPRTRAYYGGMEVISSDLAHQQNFLRSLYLYGKLTGEEQYCKRAADVFDYHFNNLLLPTGLLQWGGHYYIDLMTLKPNGEKGMVHELKNDFPFYDLMFKVDPKAAEVFIKAFWNAHIYNWKDFEMGRHGKPTEKGIDDIWDREFGDPSPFESRAGLSFMNTGNDLMLSAITLYGKTGDEGAIKWGERLYNMYVKCRHPKTGLGVYQFSQPLKTADTDDFTITLSFYGDRAKRQLGPELGPETLEGNIILTNHANTIYGLNPQIVALYYTNGAPQGERMLKLTAQSLEAYARYGYVAETNEFKPLFADGRDLTGFVPARPGYYGVRPFKRHPATGRFLLSYTQTALLLGDDALWQTGRQIASGLGLGDIGSMKGEGISPDMQTGCADAAAVMALVSIYRHSGEKELLELADKVAANIVATGRRADYFARSPEFAAYRLRMDGCNIDTQDPLAVLAVEAAKQGRFDIIPFAVY